MNAYSDIRYVRAADGAAIAYEARGSGPPLLYCRGWISHLELQRRTPTIERMFAPIRRHRTVIKYDTRGNGLSEWEPPEPVTRAALLNDLESVAETIRQPTFDLWATTYGGPLAIEYAAKHPDRVTRMVLDGTFARGRDFMNAERAEAFFDLLKMARLNPDMVFASLSFMTDPSPEVTHEVRVEHLRKSVSARVIEQLYRIAYECDVTDMLPLVRSPVLVMHRERSRAVPLRAAQRLVGMLPDATLRVLSGEAHNPYEGNWREPLAAVAEFLGFDVDSDVAAPSPTAVLTVVMFTDIVGSTAMNSQFGDHVAQDVRRRHDEVVRRTLGQHSGAEVKHTGDGIMASFRSVTDAVRAARSIRADIRAGHLQDTPELAVRIGLNAGEPLPDEGDLFGGVVQVAARVCDRAGANEIVVTDVVRELLRGKHVSLEDYGVHDLKGIPDGVRLWRLTEDVPAAD